MTALEEAVASLVRSLDPPLFIEGMTRFRYLKRTSQHVQILKAVRVVSGLYASVVLIRSGFTQEAGVLFRTIDDFLQDIWFLHEAHYNPPAPAQQEFLQQFFAKDIRTTEEIMKGTPKTRRVPAKKKRASEARTFGKHEDPEQMLRRLEGLDDMLSGYVHGEYPNIMEMYQGSTNPKNEGFLMHGMLATPRMEDFQTWLPLFVHPALNTVAMLLFNVRDSEQAEKLLAIRKRLETSGEYSGDRHKARPGGPNLPSS